MKWQGQTTSALTEAELRSWWRRYPDSNVGIVTGRISNLVVLDIDGPQGQKSLDEFGYQEISAASVRTGGGGRHIYFRYPKGFEIPNRVGMLDHVDVRSDGGFVIAPPSIHKSGNAYIWESGRSLDDCGLVVADLRWMLPDHKGGAGKREPSNAEGFWYENVLRGVGEGERNAIATRLAGRYLGIGMTPTEVLEFMDMWNERNDPPLPLREIETIVNSISQREFNAGAPDSRTREEIIANLSRLWKMEVLAIKRITGDSSQYIIHFPQGTCTLDTDTLMNPSSFQRAIAEATRRVIRKLSARTVPTHDGMAQDVMTAAEEIDAGIEATRAGEILALASRFVVTYQRGMETIKTGDKAPDNGSFIVDGCIWISLTDLHQFGTRWGLRAALPQLAQWLKATGWDKGSFITRKGDKPRPVWGIPLEALHVPASSERSIVATEEDEGDN